MGFSFMQYRLLVVAITAALIQLVGLAFHNAQAQEGSEASDEQPPIGKWTVVGEMHQQREYPGGVTLQDGRVLAVSGHPLAGKSIASAELYDPKTAKWSETGSLGEARNSGNRATLLVDGRVLVVGGHTNAQVIRSAELFDPATGTWSVVGMLAVTRDPIATLLADGRVLLAGGINWYIDEGKMYADCELFDPATGTWTATGSLSVPRNEHRMLRLDDGRVLAFGGYGPGDGPVASAELYDPASGRWQQTGAMPQPRAWFEHAKLHDGRLLVVGGYTGSRNKRTYLKSVVVYDPRTGRFSESMPMLQKRAGFAIALLAGGQVLVCGGVAESGVEIKNAELFDPQTETWRVAAPMNVARRNHRAAVLPDGNILVIGGSNLFGAKYLRSCEIYRPF